jgi:hypothetical protein
MSLLELLGFVSISPVLAFIYDGYISNDVPKGIRYLLSFIGYTVVGVFLTMQMGPWIVIFVPFALLIVVLYKKVFN